MSSGLEKPQRIDDSNSNSESIEHEREALVSDSAQAQALTPENIVPSSLERCAESFNSIATFELLLRRNGITRLRWQPDFRNQHNANDCEQEFYSPGKDYGTARNTIIKRKKLAKRVHDSTTNDTLPGEYIRGGEQVPSPSETNATNSGQPISASDSLLPKNPFVASQKRFVFGAEIALAVIVAAAGATKIRSIAAKDGPRAELIPADNTKGKSVAESTAIYFVKDKSNTQNTCAGPPNLTIVPARPKTIIASTDTLISIAEAFFYDPNVAWLIADLNISALKETWMDGKRVIELKSRQQIELPLKEDIEDFYRTKSENACAKNLVTIVEQATVDTELLNSALGGLLDQEK